MFTSYLCDTETKSLEPPSHKRGGEKESAGERETRTDQNHWQRAGPWTVGSRRDGGSRRKLGGWCAESICTIYKVVHVNPKKKLGIGKQGKMGETDEEPKKGTAQSYSAGPRTQRDNQQGVPEPSVRTRPCFLSAANAEGETLSLRSLGFVC